LVHAIFVVVVVRIGADSIRRAASSPGHADELVDLATTNLPRWILVFSGVCAEERIFPVAQPPRSAPALNVRFS
jgi:hypothetical protein